MLFALQTDHLAIIGADEQAAGDGSHSIELWRIGEGDRAAGRLPAVGPVSSDLALRGVGVNGHGGNMDSTSSHKYRARTAARWHFHIPSGLASFAEHFTFIVNQTVKVILVDAEGRAFPLRPPTLTLVFPLSLFLVLPSVRRI